MGRGGIVEWGMADYSEAAPATALAQLVRPSNRDDEEREPEPHDEEVPVASFVDDLERKVKLKKVMGRPSQNKFNRTGLSEQVLPGEDDEEDDPDDDEIDDLYEPPEDQYTKEETNYRYSGVPERSCGACRYFVEPGACQLVSGLIRPVDVCDLFEPREEGDEEMTRAHLSEGGLVEFAPVHEAREHVKVGGKWVPSPGEEGPVRRARITPEQKKLRRRAAARARADVYKSLGMKRTPYGWEGEAQEQDEAGTSAGAKKGWETRKAGGRVTPAMARDPELWRGVPMGDPSAVVKRAELIKQLGPERLRQRLRWRGHPSRIDSETEGRAVAEATGMRTVQAKLVEADPATVRCQESNCFAHYIEVTPPGFERVVKALKRRPGVRSPWAVAWAMRKKGVAPKSAEGEGRAVSFPGGKKVHFEPGSPEAEQDVAGRRRFCPEHKRWEARDEWHEVSPPGWEPTVKHLKKYHMASEQITNPYALAWWMQKRGFRPGGRIQQKGRHHAALRAVTAEAIY